MRLYRLDLRFTSAWITARGVRLVERSDQEEKGRQAIAAAG